MKKLRIIDSTTISLFSNLIFKGVGRNPKTGKKKGGMKVHTCIHGNENVPCDVEFSSAATHDHFMLCPGKLSKGDLLAIDSAYIDYAKFEEMTQRGIVYVTRMKQNFPLRYFYGESANAIKIQVWVTLIANLLITLLQKCVSRSWSFSGLATIVRIMLMYYIDGLLILLFSHYHAPCRTCSAQHSGKTRSCRFIKFSSRFAAFLCSLAVGLTPEQPNK